jgi:Tol biopolymer transport system component
MRLSLCLLPLLISGVLSATTTRVSTSTAGAQANGASFSARVSDNGRYVVFQSSATDLVANDTNGFQDVFLKDTETGETRCLSCAGNGNSTVPFISGDGAFASFQSVATNLVSGDTNGASDVFVVNLATNAIELVSKAATAGGALGNGTSGQARLSADGRYVAFASTATNLVGSDTNGQADIFLRDRQTDTVERISVATGGAQASGGTGGATTVAMSADARYFVFISGQQTLDTGDTANIADAFLRDRTANTTARINPLSANTSGSCADPMISADGAMVGFSSSLTDLVPNDTNAVRDTFYRTRGGTVLQRLTAGGVQVNGVTDGAQLSGNGAMILFASAATNLGTTDTNARDDIYSFDFAGGVISRISVTDTGLEATGGNATFPWVSASGNRVVYGSIATNMVPNDTNGVTDVFSNQLTGSDLLFRSTFE